MYSLLIAGQPEDVTSLYSSKSSLKHIGKELDAMISVAKAAREKSLDAFKAAVHEHSLILTSDALISHHLEKLYENMFESNLLKIIAPYSAVEVTFIAKLINLTEDMVSSIHMFDVLISGDFCIHIW
jgi:26S proteasome regulatory subunit N6